MFCLKKSENSEKCPSWFPEVIQVFFKSTKSPKPQSLIHLLSYMENKSIKVTLEKLEPLKFSIIKIVADFQVIDLILSALNELDILWNLTNLLLYSVINLNRFLSASPGQQAVGVPAQRKGNPSDHRRGERQEAGRQAGQQLNWTDWRLLFK